MTTALPGLARARWVFALLALAASSAARGSSLSVEDGAVVLGRTESARVVVQVDEPPGTEVLPLRLSVNVGSFSEPVRIGPGRFSAIYLPPSTRFPQVALVAAWRETGPAARIDFLRIPLFGQAKVPVAARPGAEVVARVGPDRFGPVPANRRGRAEVPILVPPEVDRCEVTITEAATRAVSKEVALEAPPYNRLTAALVPHAVVADGASTVRMDVYYDLGGINLPPERVRVTPSLGTAQFQQASKGRYTFIYVAPAETAATAVDFAVSVVGDPVATASARLQLGATAPEKVIVTAPEGSATAPTSSIPVQVLVLDGAGMGLPGVGVTATANGQALPPPVDRGAGHYEFTFAPPAAYPPGGLVQFRSTATGAGKSAGGSVNWAMGVPQGPRIVASRFEPSPVPVDGQPRARLVLEVRDASGAPLEHARLLVAASHGALGRLQERGEGRYESTYVPPSGLPEGEAQVRVVDGAGTFEQKLPIPLRRAPGRLLFGLSAGYTRSPGSASGPRAGAEVWAPFALGHARFAAGLAASVGAASRTVESPAGDLHSTTRATVVPVSLKLGYEAWAGRRLSLTVGAGAVGAWARFRSALAGPAEQGFGAGWTTFLDLGWALGHGQVSLDLSYGSSTVRTTDYRIDPGGVSAVVGYRVRLL